MQSEIIRAAVDIVIDNTQPYQVSMSEAERKVLRQPMTWVTKDRRIATRALEAVMFAILEVLGFKRVEVPAEYVAGVIFSTVRKCNWQIACYLMNDFVSGEAVQLAGYDDTRKACTPERLFSLLMLCQAEYPHVQTRIDELFGTIEENPTLLEESTDAR